VVCSPRFRLEKTVSAAFASILFRKKDSVLRSLRFRLERKAIVAFVSIPFRKKDSVLRWVLFDFQRHPQHLGAVLGFVSPPPHLDFHLASLPPVEATAEFLLFDDDDEVILKEAAAPV